MRERQVLQAPVLLLYSGYMGGAEFIFTLRRLSLQRIKPVVSLTMLVFLQQVIYFPLHEAKVRLTLVLITYASLSVDQKADW
jgi:hypothetical protein